MRGARRVPLPPARMMPLRVIAALPPTAEPAPFQHGYLGCVLLGPALQRGAKALKVGRQGLPHSRQIADQQGDGFRPKFIGIEIAHKMAKTQVVLQALLRAFPQHGGVARGLERRVVEALLTSPAADDGAGDSDHHQQQLRPLPAEGVDTNKRMKRFELSTLSLARRCSTTELHPRLRGTETQPHENHASCPPRWSSEGDQERMQGQEGSQRPSRRTTGMALQPQIGRESKGLITPI